MPLAYDLIAIDLDGTLLNSGHALPPENRAALHRAHGAGMKIVLCTGRAFNETRPIIQDIGLDLDATVTVFGALVSDARTGRTLERRAIPVGTARAATAWFRKHDYPVLWLTDPDEVGHDGYMLSGLRRHTGVDEWLAATPCCVSCADELPAGAAAPLRLTVIDERMALEPLADQLRAAFDGQLVYNVLQAHLVTLIEAFAPTVNKWYGIQRLCARWGIDPRRTVAIGDEVNDLEMVQNAGLGVAMGNARPAVQAVAQRITASNDDCGVARLLDELLG